MGTMTPEAAALFAEVQDAVLAEVERVGVNGLRRDAVVRAFAGRISRRTAYRWCAEILASPTPGRHLNRKVEEAMAERAQAPEPAASLARDVTEALPARPVDALGVATAGRGSARLAFVDLIGECLKDAEQLRTYARSDDGNIRSAKILLMASAHLRKTVETAARIQETLASMAQLDEFHRAIMETVAEESPACAERIVMRLRQLSNTWADAGS